MTSWPDTAYTSLDEVIPVLHVVAPTTCGICRVTVKSMQYFIPVVCRESYQGALLVGYRVELCTACHDLVQSDPKELKRRAWDLFEFIHERITSGEELPLQIGGELPGSQR